VLTAWPRSAQLTTAFLLGVTVTLLSVQALGQFRWGARPAELERSAYRIDLNRAPRAELLQIPGVGPALADKIEQHRRERGGFRSVEELVEVPGIGPATLTRLRPWVCVNVEDAAALEPAPELRKPRTPMAKTEPIAAGPGDDAKPSGKKEPNLAAPLDINQATQAELQRLPGIGPKMSQRIIDERAKAPFKSVDDLRRVTGIGPKTLEKLRPYVRVGSPSNSVVAAESGQ
jgi:competence protein ComEA